MAGRTLEIGPLSKREILYQSLILQGSRVPGWRGRYFTQVGTFGLEETKADVTITYNMWAAKLLEFDPRDSRLSIYRGQLIVHDKGNQVLKSIPPEEIRRVAPLSEDGIVRESGYVLADHFYSLGDKSIGADEFEGILSSADGGKAPPAFDPYIRVKVDPALVGRKLWIGVLDPGLIGPWWDMDAVVIDPEERIMIAREVVRPLAPETWGKAPQD